MEVNLNPTTEADYLALSSKFMQLQKEVQEVIAIERKQKAGETITEAEAALVASMPDKMKVACDITRILRRTNTGPAKVKQKVARARSEERRVGKEC